jgi:hypothetical protein
VKHYASSIAVVLLVLGCDADGRVRDPTFPGDRPVRVEGFWTGNSTFLSASPAGNCVAEEFRDLPGFVQRLSVRIEQSGSSVRLRTIDSATGDVCLWRGSVSDAAIAAVLEDCSTPRIRGILCADDSRRDARLAAGTLEGSASRDRISADLVLSYDTFDFDTGQNTGEARVRRDFEIER